MLVPAISIVSVLVAAQLDASFGVGGVARSPFPGDEQPAALLRGDDGSLIVIGRSWGTSTSSLLALGFESDGDVDTGFAEGGAARLDLGTASSGALGAALDGEGRVLVCGYAFGDHGSGLAMDAVVTRFFADGALDVSFGVDGVVTLDVNALDDQASAIATLPGGEIVVVGRTTTDFANSVAHTNAAVWRLDASGAVVDTLSFAIEGEQDELVAVAVDDGGRVVASGTAVYDAGARASVAVVRLTGALELDAAFGDDGVALFDPGAFLAAVAVSIAARGDDLFVGATVDNGAADPDFDLTLLRVDDAGSLLDVQSRSLHTLRGLPGAEPTQDFLRAVVFLDGVAGAAPTPVLVGDTDGRVVVVPLAAPQQTATHVELPLCDPSARAASALGQGEAVIVASGCFFDPFLADLVLAQVRVPSIGEGEPSEGEGEGEPSEGEGEGEGDGEGESDGEGEGEPERAGEGGGEGADPPVPASSCACSGGNGDGAFVAAFLALLVARRRGSTCAPGALCGLGLVALSGCSFVVTDGAPELDAVAAADQASIAITPASLHFIYQSSPAHWDSIVSLAETQPNMAFVGAEKPPQVAADQWAAYVSYRSSPAPTADDIAALLSAADPPRLVMIEELHNRASDAFITALADDMEARFPEWRGRWGAFVSFGHYARLASGIDALLRADAVIALELYPRQSEYCASGANGGQRDAWLARQFNGDATLARLDWLMARRELRDSDSVITPLFGVGDVLLDGRQPAKFLDRMFYVWATRVSHPALIDAARGGPGTYKWQDIDDTPLGYGVSNTSRDLAFAQSFQHYSVERRVTSLKGPVPCE